MLSVRIDFVLAFALFNHGVVIAVASCADIKITGLLKLIVRGVAGFALHTLGRMPVGKIRTVGSVSSHNRHTQQCGSKN